MRVYYFTKEKYGLDNINRGRIKVSDFSNLNDPFELLGIELTDRNVRRAMEFEKSQIAKNSGLICFSESRDDPVQWAHYAENHRGMCLGFEVPKEKLKKVKYVSERLAASTVEELNRSDKLLITKFRHWSYEKEWRLIVDKTKKEIDHGLFFEMFSRSLELKEIFLGYKSALNFQSVASNINSNSSDVIIKHTRPSFRDFRIVWDQSRKSERA